MMQSYDEGQVRNAIEQSGVRIYSEIASHFIVFCPFHYNSNTPGGEVDKTSGMFYCFSCKESATLTDLVQRLTGGSYFSALRLIGDSSYDASKILRSIDERPEIEPYDQGVVDKLHRGVWGVGSEYFNSRRINDLSITKFELGYSNSQQMVTVPIHSTDGVLWGFVGRSVEGKRFKNSAGLKKSQTMFNIHRVWTAPRVFIVESSFDAIRLDQVGIPAVATLGAAISAEQIRIIKRTFDEVVLIPDNDDAGRSMTNKLLDEIPYAQIVEIEGAKDVSDLSDDQISDTLDG
jgi:DNA primase